MLTNLNIALPVLHANTELVYHLARGFCEGWEFKERVKESLSLEMLCDIMNGNA